MPSFSFNGEEKFNFNFKCKLLDDKGKTLNVLLWSYVIGFTSEFLGTFIFTLFACALHNHESTLAHAFITGFAITIVVQVFWPISLGQVNPAITLSYYILGFFSVPKMIVYIIAQCLGSTAAMTSLIYTKVYTRGITELYLPQTSCCTFPRLGLHVFRAFIMEFIMTSVLIYVVCSIADPRNINKMNAIPINLGLAVFICVTASKEWTGASMNPARSFGPALANMHWDDHWVYWAGPLLGSVVTTFVYHILFLPRNGQDVIIEKLKGMRDQQFYE